MTSEAPEVVTRVSRAVVGDNRFCGFSVDRELGGEMTLAGLIALAVTRRRLSAAEASLIDLVASASLAADPRIWPMKIGVLAAGHGRFVQGVALGNMAFDSDAVGPMAIGRCATMLKAMPSGLRASGTPVEAVEQWLNAALAKGERLPGFGAPFRPFDERFVTLRRLVDSRPESTGSYWRLAMQLGDAMAARAKVPPNSSLAVAALFLDLGLSVDECSALALAVLTPVVFANAFERACEPSPVLRELPVECVRYTGPAPRLSPRALAAQASERGTKPAGDAGPDSAPK